MADYPALDLRFAAGADRPTLESRLYAALDEFQPIAIDDEQGDGWLVFFRTPDARNAAALQLKGFGRGLISAERLSVPDGDWARRSQATLTAVTVGRLTIAPPWDPLAETPHASDGPLVIVIDPSMGFGTGHHQTTRLCLELLQTIAVAGRTVVDVGTGSGVLAIAAWRLGGRAIVAIDNDADAIQNARENVDRNGAAAHIRVIEASLEHADLAAADVVTANLTAAVLQHHAAGLRSLVRPGGRLIVSGFSAEEAPAVIASFDPRRDRLAVDGEWAAAVIEV